MWIDGLYIDVKISVIISENVIEMDAVSHAEHPTT